MLLSKQRQLYERLVVYKQQISTLQQASPTAIAAPQSAQPNEALINLCWDSLPEAPNV